MKRLILLLLFIGFHSITFSQENRIVFLPNRDEADLGVFMNMLGFNYHKFVLQSYQSPYVNVYIDEYLNDKLIEHFDHISANKDTAPKEYFNLIFTRLDTSEFVLKIYSLSKSDSIEEIQFRIGELGLYKKLHVNRKDFAYSWKLSEFNNNVGPIIEIGKKIPLMYYTTAVTEVVNGQTISAFCDVPNILANKDIIENQGKIKHYFEIGVELVDKIE